MAETIAVVEKYILNNCGSFFLSKGDSSIKWAIEFVVLKVSSRECKGD